MKPRDVAMFFIAMLVVVVTWAVGIPKFASPDETAHVFKAYGTAHGQLLGEPVPPPFPNNLREFDGPDSLGPTNLQCFNGQPDVPAACATEVSPQLISSAAWYPVWYYGLVGVPVAVAGQSESVFAYRLVSAGLCVALLTLAMCVGKRAVRADVVALQLVALTPMALFLMASVDPNAIEIAGFVAIWACLTRVTTDAEVPGRLLVLASVLSAAVVLMRPIAIVWMISMVAIVLILTSAQRRRELMSRRLLIWSIGPTAIALLASWAWALYARIEVKDERLTNSLSLVAALRQSVDNWGTYVRQTVGVLGWLDTTLPSFVYALWIMAIVVIVLIHLRAEPSARAGACAVGGCVAGAAVDHQRVHQLPSRPDLSGPLLVAALRRPCVPADVEQPVGTTLAAALGEVAGGCSACADRRGRGRRLLADASPFLCGRSRQDPSDRPAAVVAVGRPHASRGDQRRRDPGCYVAGRPSLGSGDGAGSVGIKPSCLGRKVRCTLPVAPFGISATMWMRVGVLNFARRVRAKRA